MKLKALAFDALSILLHIIVQLTFVAVLLASIEYMIVGPIMDLILVSPEKKNLAWFVRIRLLMMVFSGVPIAVACIYLRPLLRIADRITNRGTDVS